jgi:hypothetical protein
MIVWKTTAEDRSPPPWLPDGSARYDLVDGTLWTLRRYQSRLGVTDASWIELPAGRRVALYGPVDPRHYLRDLHWSLPAPVTDAHGRTWTVPLVLDPDGRGVFAREHRFDAAAGEWVSQAVSPLARRAVEACEAAAPTIHDPETAAAVPLEIQIERLCAVLEATHHLDAASITRLGLIDDVLLLHGLRVACGDPRPVKAA